MNIEDLTEEQLRKIINHIRVRFSNQIIVDDIPLSLCANTTSISNVALGTLERLLKDRPKINTMKDDEILTAILNNKIAITNFQWIYLGDYVTSLLKEWKNP